MTASSNSDCYLCGAQNEPDASFCARCNGQLLRIPGAEATEPEAVATPEPEPTEVVDRDELLSAEPNTKRRRTRKGNLQDQRLSDALGLTEEVPLGEVDRDDPGDDDGWFAETVVTSIPRATQSSEIPLLGTRAGAVPQAAMDRETGTKTYVLLAFLLVFTGWFGYNTITREAPQPDSIAFASTSTTMATTTTTTEKPEREWQENEVQGQYRSMFVTVSFYSCDAANPNELLDTANGVIASTHNVVTATAPANAGAAIIRSRTGQRRLAMVDRSSDGLIVATATRATARNLSDFGASDDPPRYFVSYDPETKIATTSAASNGEAVSEVLVTSTGKVNSVRIGQRTISSDDLVAIDNRYEINPDVPAPEAGTPCSNAKRHRLIVPEGQELIDESTNQPSQDGADAAAIDEE